MGIFLFFTFFLCDLIVIVACGYEYKKYNQYKDGMILGVHIPAEAMESEEVQRICQKEKRWRNVFQRMNYVLNLAVCLLCLYRFELGFLFWLMWLVEYLVGIEVITNRPHKAMYQLKMRNQWVREGARHLVHIDTRVAVLSRKEAYSWKWHLLIVVITGASGIWLIMQDSWFVQESVGMVLYVLAVGVSLLFLGLHVWIVENRNIVYSQNSDVNLAVNQLVKRNWSLAFLSASVCSGFAWIYFAWKIWQKDWIGNFDYVVYTVLQLLGTVAFLYFICGIQEKKREILEMDDESIYVDDDEYWKNGYYSNPSDRRLLVPGRISSTNYTFNMARPAGRIIYGGILMFTAGALGWAAMMMISMLTMDIAFTVRTENRVINVVELMGNTEKKRTDEDNLTVSTGNKAAWDVDFTDGVLGIPEDYRFCFSAADYECEFSASDIQDVELLTELPDDRFSKINGGATERYNVGHFKGKETGKTMMFLWEGYSPILKIELTEVTVFANSKESGEVELWYEYLRKD